MINGFTSASICAKKRRTKVEKTGFGVGQKKLEIAIVLKAEIGILKTEKDLIILETDIDDMNPEFFSYVIERLLETGAVEAFIRPVVMKKDRIGVALTAIGDRSAQERLIETIFAETSTFGIRVNKLCRVILDRKIEKVKTKYGLIDVKVCKYKGKTMTVSPEYEICKKLARKTGVPIKEIYNAALAD